MYWVPLTAPVEEMELGDSSASSCSQALTTWLAEYGTLIASPQVVLVRSTEGRERQLGFAADGSFRAPVPGFVVQCGSPSIAGGGGDEGEIEWQRSLVRFEDEGVSVLEATEEGPQAVALTVSAAKAHGMLALLQGPVAFEGELVVSTPGTEAVSVPFWGAGKQATTDIYWPGIPPSGTLRVAVAEDSDTGEVEFLCSAASESAYAAARCDASTGPLDNQIRQQAVRYRENFEQVQERDRLRAAEPQTTTLPGTATKLTRLDPWADSALDDKETLGSTGDCYRDHYRLDRIRCSASLTCYLNDDETLGACQSLSSWEVYVVDGVSDLPPDPHAPMDVEMLRLADGAVCRFHTGAGPFPPEGYDAWVGSCRDGSEVLWAKIRTQVPLDQSFLLEPAVDGGMLRVVAGVEGMKPNHYEVAEIFY